MLRGTIRGIASITFVAVFSTFGVQSQQQKQTVSTQPTTKMEEFSARTGVVVIRGYSRVGYVVVSQGSVTVEAREFRDASNPNTPQYGLSIEVAENGQLERKNMSYVDYDEIESLVKGIDYVAKIDKTVTPMNEFEAEYRTKADFAVTTFNRGNKIDVSVESGRIGKTQVFLNLAQLSQLRTLILSAKTIIESAMTTPSK